MPPGKEAEVNHRIAGKIWAGWMWLACAAALAGSAAAQERSDGPDSVEYWQHQLSDPAPTYRVQAAARLGRLGSAASPAVDDLLVALEDPQPEVRMQAVVALVQIGVRPLEVGQHLLDRIGDPNEHVDYAAQWGLAHLSDRILTDCADDQEQLSAALELLSRAVERCQAVGGHPLQSQKIDRRLRACREQLVQLQAEALHQQHLARARKHLSEIVEWVSTGGRLDRYRAVEELSPDRLARNAWDDVLPPEELLQARIQILIDSRDSMSPTFQRYAQWRWGPAFQDALFSVVRTQMRESSDTSIAERLLIHFSITSERDWHAVVDLLGPEYPLEIRQAAAWALGQSSIYPAQTVLELAELLASVHEAPTQSSDQPAGDIGRTDPSAEPTPQRDDSAYLAGAAMHAMLDLLEERQVTEMPSPAEERVQAILLQIQRDSNQTVGLRHAATRALSLLWPDSLEAMQGFLAAGLDAVKDYELADALRAIERFDRVGMADALIERALRSEDALARRTAIRLANRLGSSSAVALLLNRVEDPEETFENLDAAIEELRRIDAKAILIVAQRLQLHNPGHAGRTLSALAHWTAGCPEALPVYIQWAEDTTQGPFARCAALFCIARLGSDAQSVSARLRDLFENRSTDGRLRAAALVALHAAGGVGADELAAAQASDIPHVAIAADKIAAAEGSTLAADRLVVRLHGPHRQLAAGALEDLGATGLPSLRTAVFDRNLPDDLRLAALEVALRIPDVPRQPWLAVLEDERIGEDSLWVLDENSTLDQTVELVHYLTQASYRHSDPAMLNRLESLVDRLDWGRGGGSGPGDLPSPSKFADAVMRLDSYIYDATANAEAESSIEHEPMASGAESSSAVEPPSVKMNIEQPIVGEPPSLDRAGSWPPPGGGGSAAAPDIDRREIDVDSASPTNPSAATLPAASAGSAGNVNTGEDGSRGPDTGPDVPGLAPDATDNALDARPLQPSSPDPHRAQGPLVRVFYGTNRLPRAAAAGGAGLRAAATQVSAVILYLGMAAVFAVLMLWNRVRLLAFPAMLLSLGLFVHRMQSTSGDPAPTERETTATKIRYTGELSSELRLGVCQVSIPPVHRTGEVERPSVLRFQFREDPGQHVVIQSVEEVAPDRFFSELSADAERRGGGVLVFIHGYNVSFDEAVMRTAQLAYDLDYPGSPVTFSWPSCGDWYKYQVDRRHIELSVPVIRQFLENLANRTGARSIDVIAHSMGNVGLTQALAELSADQATPINNVVLAAPDIDADIFATRIAPRLVGKARRFTVYTSDSDLALRASRYFNTGRRLGEALRPQPQFPGIDVIDASGYDTSLLGHSYYGSSSGILRDLSKLLRGEPIQQRPDVRVARAENTTYRFLSTEAAASSTAVPQ
ncbi:MAG: alpha/beta hydrolase [Planctomycetota bacterium]|nr:MAG: alpha/beta hydrolase [Planctomycetota bacterium]